jgi:hypothetical protein
MAPTWRDHDRRYGAVNLARSSAGYRSAPPLRNRWFADSALERTGFEPSVPLLRKGLSAVAERRCRTDKLDGVIKHRSSPETTVVGRGPPLDGRLFDGGTDGSNPSSSSGESGTNRDRGDQRSLACGGTEGSSSLPSSGGSFSAGGFCGSRRMKPVFTAARVRSFSAIGVPKAFRPRALIKPLTQCRHTGTLVARIASSK